jgi:ParB family chromosome partitioning protein
MSKSDALLNKFGGTIQQTVGRRPAAMAEAVSTAPAPDKYAGAVRSRAFAEMPIEAIACEDQPRTEFDPEDLRRLAESIQRFGQLAPIRVRRDEAAGRWVVLVGERRLRACRLAGLERVRVELVERPMSDSDILAEQVVENVVRADLQPIEQARAYRRLMDLNGWTAQELAEVLGAEPSGVYRALALLKLPEEVAEQVDNGAIKPTAAYELTKLQIADDQREVARKVVAEGLDHGQTVAEVKRRKSSGRGARAKGKGRAPVLRRYRGPAGVRITVQATARHSPADIAADLRAIAAQLEGDLSASEAA